MFRIFCTSSELPGRTRRPYSNRPPGKRKDADVREERRDGVLRVAALAFIAAVAIHGGDHALRGTENQSPQVLSGGTVQALFGLLAVALVLRGHRWAPVAAMAVGFASAVLFASAHLLPSWGAFSDSYVTPAAGAGVTWFSWITAFLEIGADLFFGWAGAKAVMRSRSREGVVA
jgi:hypothetical protein